MNKKAIIYIGFVTVGILGLMAWGYATMAGPTTTQLGTPSVLTVSEQLHDFGTISMAGGKVKHLFRLTNPTDRAVTISEVSTSCMCTNAFIVNGAERLGPFGMPGMGGINAANLSIPPRGSANIDVVFDPAAHGPAGVGDIDRFVYASESGGGTVSLEVKAIVTP